MGFLSKLFKGIGKVFKKVVSVVKKIAIPALLIGGVMLATGGLGALGIGGAAAGTAAAGGAAATGAAAAAGTAAAGTAAGGLASGIASSGGLWGAIKGIFSSPIVGQVIQGAASAYGEYQNAKLEEQMTIDGEQRHYGGVGAAIGAGLGGGSSSSSSSSSTPRRPGAVPPPERTQGSMFQYDPMQRRVVSN